MTDPRTLAQREGPEAMEALVRAVCNRAGWDTQSHELDTIIAAARAALLALYAEPQGEVYQVMSHGDGSVVGVMGTVLTLKTTDYPVTLHAPRSVVRVSRVEGA